LNDLFARFYECHSELIDFPKSHMLALMDVDGNICEDNSESIGLPENSLESGKLADALVESSRQLLKNMLVRALDTGQVVREILHFACVDGSLPTSYNCVAVSNSEDRLFFYAEKKPALNDEQAHEYAIINNELSVVTRQLQKTNHSLAFEINERKQAQESLARVAERDHHIAEVLQQVLMPSYIQIQPLGYEIAAKYQPASKEAEVCGDFCDVFDLGESRIGISVGDIVGKGLLAAMRITAVKNMLRSYAYLYDQPSKVMELLNDALCRDISMENDMLTAFFAVLDTSNDTLTYSSAGHEPPILRRSNGSIEHLNLGGVMFCGMGKQTYAEDRLNLDPGDMFVAVTDGITEASLDKRAQQFGTAGIINCMSASASVTAEHIATVILENATEFANGDLHDDATIVVVKKASEHNNKT